MTKYMVSQQDREQAERLTKRIQAAADDLWTLLLEAWNRKAHVAMGYKTWTAYVEAEFDFSRRQSYRLIHQGQVTKQLREAAGVTHGSQIAVTEREARDLAAHMPEVIDQIESGVPVRVAVERVRETVTRSRFDDGYDIPDEPASCAHEYVCRHCGELA